MYNIYILYIAKIGPSPPSGNGHGHLPLMGVSLWVRLGWIPHMEVFIGDHSFSHFPFIYSLAKS